MPLVSPNAKMKQSEMKSKFLTKLKDLNEKIVKGTVHLFESFHSKLDSLLAVHWY